MEFRLLGPLEVQKDDRVLPVGGAKQRALLAILLLHANEFVSRDRLIDGLWGERPPGTTAAHSLDHQVSRLRKTLDLAELLLTRPGGYVLEVDPERIDVHRFERLVTDGREANVTGRSKEAMEALRQALDLWRGPALADFAYEHFARGEIERLDELRLSAIEERIDAELALGRHQAVVAELESAAARHPLRERLRGQLMLALYRSGRQSEALRVYADARRTLVDDLGIEPGPALRALEQAILRQDPALDVETHAKSGTPESRRHRRLALLTLLALALAAGAAAAGVLIAGGGTQSPQAQTLAEPDSVVFLDASHGEVMSHTSVRLPALSRFYGKALWNVSYDGELTRVDPATGKVVESLGTGVTHPCGLEVGAGSVWVTDCLSPTLVRIDPRQNVVASRITLPRRDPHIATQTGGVAVGAGSVWVAQGVGNPSWVDRIDPATGRVYKRIVIPEGGAQRVAFGDGALWVAGAVEGFLSKIDPRTNKIAANLQGVNESVSAIAAGGGYAWAATTGDHLVLKIAADGSLVSSISLAADAADLTYADGAVWVADGRAGTVVRVDATTSRKRTFWVGHHVLGVAAGSGVVAAGVLPDAQDITTGLKGRIVRVALKSDYLDQTSTDPLATLTPFDSYQVQFQYATCAKLFNYPDAPGAAGEKLVPEVAVAWPSVTDGGRTYTFRIRPGYRFSPPSNEEVTAETFRHEIERTLSPALTDPVGLKLLPEIVGAQAYSAGKAPHVSGVSAHGDKLVIRLVRPAPDLPTLLALPFFCAVPVETPVVAGGVDTPIASAGPYYLAARAEDVVVLKANPNYHGPRPHHLDAIDYHLNVDVGQAAGLVAQGKFDYVAEDDPALAPDTAAARAAGSRYRLTPTNWTEGLQLNTRRPLFADMRLRRAVAYALDRRTLATDLAGDEATATSHALAPDLPGFHERGYPLSPDLRIARKLTGGRHLHAVFATVADPAGAVYDTDFVEALREQLAAIGISVTVLPVPQSTSPPKRAALLARADLTRIEGNWDQTRDPVAYLASQAYLPEADRARLEQIATYSTPRRELAAAMVATRLERDAVYLGIADRTIPELVSKRLGCVIDQPEYPGLDLAAFCLR